jgi:hypothetical protein
MRHFPRTTLGQFWPPAPLFTFTCAPLPPINPNSTRLGHPLLTAAAASLPILPCPPPPLLSTPSSPPYDWSRLPPTEVHAVLHLPPCRRWKSNLVGNMAWWWQYSEISVRRRGGVHQHLSVFLPVSCPASPVSNLHCKPESSPQPPFLLHPPHWELFFSLLARVMYAVLVESSWAFINQIAFQLTHPQFLSWSAPTSLSVHPSDPSLFFLQGDPVALQRGRYGSCIITMRFASSGSGELLSADIWFPFCCVGNWNRKFPCYFARCEETYPWAGGLE